MPELRSTDDVRTWLSVNAYAPRANDAVIGKVGLEVELFPFWMATERRPAARLALVETIGIVDAIPGAVQGSGADGRPSWTLDGTLITEEPGAQLEVAGPPDADADQALTRVERVVATLTTAFEQEGAGLAAVGVDCWSGPNEVPVQLDVSRYDAMTTYFRRRGGSSGRLLMCSSCSLQINVDLGPPEVAAARWLLANLAAPVFTAAFSTSPGDGVGGEGAGSKGVGGQGVVNDRALGWRRLDPTRTGVSPALLDGSDDPVGHVLVDALRADVMFIERHGHIHAGHPGWTFGDWLRDSHADHGRPTTDDLRQHLTTLFPEARLRGYLEIRSVDALPARWRGAAVALVVGLMYDDEARSSALEVLRSLRGELPALLKRCAVAGLGDPVLGQVSLTVLEAGLAGAQRLAIPQAAQAEEFLETFTRRARHPADELRAALSDEPGAAFAWARA